MEGNSTLTQGETIRHPQYMAPEQPRRVLAHPWVEPSWEVAAKSRPPTC